MNNNLPTGTITFLFTDIEGSTPLWEQHPREMGIALQIHNAALRQAIETNGGAVFKTVGDAFQATFSTAPQALKAAIEGQRALQSSPWNELGPLKVRMGLHTGEAELDAGGDEYAVSHTKNRIGRIHSAAHGGQILLSQETADLLQRALPAGVMLKDMGEHRLKGMALPEHLFQVIAPDLTQEFPALGTAITRPNNLPLHMTAFIGRETELTTVRRLLADHRLVTLTGSGGTGKTRLTLQVAAETLEHYPNGAWLAELATLADPSLVPKTVASALGVPETPGRDIQESLVNFLRQKHLLLILDNCEHLLQACACLADVLLHACPGLTILTSSREILGVEGETPFRVPSMTLPDLHHLPPLAELPRFDAIRLFSDRGRVVSPGFAITEDNAPMVAQVVNRLDGIPLAIELAARRLRLLSVEQIASRLNDAFRLLTGGSRTVLPRHQTLRALIDWSYNLLSVPERIILRRLSVFAGSWTLEAAERVCADENEARGAILPADILDHLAGLVDKSMIFSTNEVGGTNRFGMLETIRQYTHEKLVDEREAETARSRHMQYFCRLAKELMPKIRSREQIKTLDRLELELGNLRLALDWGLQTDIETELSLAAVLKWLWHIRTHWSEGIDWLKRGLEADQASRDAAPPSAQRAVIRADALSVLGFHFRMQAMYSSDFALKERIKACLEESMALFQASGSENTSGYAWAVLELEDDTNLEQLQLLAQKALRIFRQIGDLHGAAEALQALAWCEIDPAHKRRYHQEQLAIDQANGDIEGIATAFFQISYADSQEAEWEHALQAEQASLAYYRQVQNPNMLGMESVALASLFGYNGDLLRAGQCLNEALKVYSDIGDETGVAMCWFVRSWLNIAEGLYPQASEALGQAGRTNQWDAAAILALRARLARLQGDAEQAQQLAQEGLKISRGQPSSVDILLELGHQALESGDLPGAKAYWREGIQYLIRTRNSGSWEFFLDGLALLAARQGKPELVVHLFSTRWCRGYFHWHSPSERATRTTILAEIHSYLGEERFAQLSQAAQALTFMQMLAAVREFLELN